MKLDWSLFCLLGIAACLLANASVVIYQDIYWAIKVSTAVNTFVAITIIINTIGRSK